MLVNNIAHSFTTCFAVPAPWGGSTGTNLSSDGTAPVSGERGVPLSGVGGVNFVDPVAQNFHLQSSSQAVNRGTTLATTYIYDIDNQARVSTWDIGADEYNGFTAVRLASFRATGFDVGGPRRVGDGVGAGQPRLPPLPRPVARTAPGSG